MLVDESALDIPALRSQERSGISWVPVGVTSLASNILLVTIEGIFLLILALTELCSRFADLERVPGSEAGRGCSLTLVL